MRLGRLVIGGALALAACAAQEPTDDGEGWAVDHTVQEDTLVSVWGTGPDDVWAVGGTEERGLVLHWDGESWSPVETGADALLWWVYGFRADDIYAAGERGLLLHYDGSTWQRVQTGTDRALYGIWGASGEDIWIVGGDPAVPKAAVALRGHGTSFSPVTDLPPDLAPAAVYKAYGYAADDVILVGSDGTVLRWNGDIWRREPTPTFEPIFSLWGRSQDDIYAVGGWQAGSLLHFDGAEWTEVDGEVGAGLSGVFTAPGQPIIAVGPSSYIVEVEPDGTQVEPVLPALEADTAFHGIWGDGTGTAWAVGGDLLAWPSPTRGVILRRR